MKTETTSRTIRFRTKEAQEIDLFLENNPVFDFSTLARTAIAEFIRNPKLRIHPLLKSEKMLNRSQRARTL